MKTIVKAGTDQRISLMEKENRELARKAAAEGFVLLKNNGVLPLREKRIALYGSGARMTVKGGTGSGAVRERYSVSIAQGLENAGYTITTTGWLDRFDQYYEDTYEAYRQEQEERVKGLQSFYEVLGTVQRFLHPTGIPVTDEDIKESDTDTAIYVLARQAGEGEDRKDVPGDYQLSDIESENLKKVCEGYAHVIVVVNVGGMLDLSFMDHLSVDGLIYFVQGGEEGGNAFADVVSGKVNFSGKLSTSWPYCFSDLPSNTTYSYLGEDEYNQEYTEGIYVGYRFFDSFGVKPRYHFGYGLSYTRFSLCAEKVEVNENMAAMEIAVRNEGEFDGKEVVQLYATTPFGKGAEYQRLMAFGKTSTIATGASETMSLSFPIKDLARYEEESASYVLIPGDYVLRLGTASNQTKPVAVIRLKEKVTTEICTNICPVQHEVKEIVPPKRAEENLEGIPVYMLDSGKFTVIRHTYPDLPVYTDEKIKGVIESMPVSDLATLVCGGGTSGERLVMAMGASGSTTAELFDKYGIPNVICSDGPAGLNLTSHIVEMPDGSWKAARVPENMEAYKRYLFGMTGKAMLSQMADPADGVSHYQYCTAWLCSQLLAQSFNQKLLEQVGDAVGKEMEAYGVTVWLAPGMNIHRNPLCGRTFEYYSEDPLVSGKMAAAIVCGVQSHPGKGMSIKHFVANNCELHRNESSSNMSERTLRELYLKGFEIAVKESSPMTVMASYNMVNGVYATNNHDTLVKVLRNEWGFEGMVMSDWDSITCERGDSMKARTADILKAPAAQCDLIMPGRPDQIEALKRGVEEGLVKLDDLKRCAARVLEMVAGNTVYKYKIME